MKLITAILPFFLSSLVASKSSSFWGGEQRVLDDVSVPGDNPLNYCQLDTSKDILTIQHVNLTPNPPEKLVDDTFKRSVLIANISLEAKRSPSKLKAISPKRSQRGPT